MKKLIAIVSILSGLLVYVPTVVSCPTDLEQEEIERQYQLQQGKNHA